MKQYKSDSVLFDLCSVLLMIYFVLMHCDQ